MNHLNLIANKKFRNTPGLVFEISLGENKFCYGQVLTKAADCIIFDYLSDGHVKDFSLLTHAPELFQVGLYKDIIPSGCWPVIGRAEVLHDVSKTYVYDRFNHAFFMYNHTTGNMDKVTKSDCMGGVRAAAWDKHHVEDRIYDYYHHKPCMWLWEEYSIWLDTHATIVQRSGIQRVKSGDVLRIPIHDKYYFCQVLSHNCNVIRVFDYESANQYADIENLLDRPSLFEVSVMSNVLSSTEWAIVGTAPLGNHIMKPQIWSDNDFRGYKIFEPDTETIREASPDECQGLEYAVAWTKKQVEDRISDHYAGRPCIWAPGNESLLLERLKIEWGYVG